MQLLGQGDNQVLCVKINLLDRSEAAVGAAVTKFQNFRSEVFKTFQDLALPIKAEETWSSSELFAYGKDLYYQGRRLGLRSKRASRTCFLVNDGYPSITDYIGSMASAIITLNEECHSSLVPWLLYNINLRMMTYSLGRYHPLLHRGCLKCPKTHVPQSRFEREYNVPSGDLSILFSVSIENLNRWLISAKSALTGVPGLCPLDLLMHGFPDNLTLALTWVHFLTGLTGYSSIVSRMVSPPLSQTPSPLQLCEDPTSIPLLTPPAIKNRLRAIVSQYLSTPSMVKNREFREFLNISLNSQVTLATALFQITPCNPRLMADIISATPIGQATALVCQVSSTTTMNRLMFEYEGDSLSIRMTGLEYSLLNWICYLVVTSSNNKPVRMVCPTEQARLLRKIGWGKDLIGVTVPLSVHYLKESQSTAPPQSYIIARLSGLPRPLLEAVRGPFPEYIGSRTIEKTAKVNTLSTANLSPLILRPLKLLRLIGWIVGYNGRLNKLLYDIYNAATDINPSQFIHQYLEVSGSAEHRYEDARTSHTITFAGSWLAPTHCLVSLAQWIDYCKGSKNKTILFQEVIVTRMKLMYENSLFNTDPYHLTKWFVEACPQCIRDTYDGSYELPPTVVVPNIPSFPLNNTLFLSSSVFSRVLPLVVRFKPVTGPIQPTDLTLSYGIHLALSGQRINTALVQKVNPIMLIHGYALALIAKQISRKVLTLSMRDEFTLNLKRVARRILFDDVNKFSSLELLVQYPVSAAPLLATYGITALPSEFPYGKVARRSSIRLILAATVYHWALGNFPVYDRFKLLIEKRESHYTEEILILILTLIITHTKGVLDPRLLKLLAKLDSSCRTEGQTKLTSLWTLVSAIKGIVPSSLSAESILSIMCPFEVMLKSQPTLSESVQPSSVIHLVLKRSLSISCPIVIKSHNSEINIVYPKVARIPEINNSVFHRLNKPLSHPTSAWYKWSCILADSVTDFKRPCCLADGSGGLSRFCYDLSHSKSDLRTVFFSTLPVTPDADEYSYEFLLPPVLLSLPNVHGNVELQHGIGDLTDVRTLPMLIRSISAYRASYVTCDAEHINAFRDNTKQLTLAMIQLVNALNCPVIFKTYREPFLLHRWQISTFLQNGVKVRGLLSPYSPECSSECFLVLTTDGVKTSKVEGALDSRVKNTHHQDLENLTRLTMSRLPLYSSILGLTPVWDTIAFDLMDTHTVESTLIHIIAHTEEQLTSLKYFPDVGRPGVGQVQYISSTSLSWLTLSHLALQRLKSGQHWAKALETQKPIIFLYASHGRVRSSLTHTQAGIRYVVKYDTHFKNVRRRWITLLSIKEM